MSPDGTLATEAYAGGKLEKSRFTANFCCKASGTKKLLPWFIGTAKTLRCFTDVGVNIANLPRLKEQQKGMDDGSHLSTVS